MGSSGIEARLIDCLDEAIIAVDTKYRITHWNQASERLLGWPACEVVGQRLFQIFSNRTDLHPGRAILKQVHGGGTWQGLLGVTTRAGQRLLLPTTVVGLRDEHGRFLGMAGVHWAPPDGPAQELLIEAMQVQLRLQESEERFRSLVEQKQVGVYLVQDERFCYLNPRLAEILGYEREELMAVPTIMDLVHPEDLPMVRAQHLRRVRGELVPGYCFRMRRRNGELIVVEVYGSRTLHGGRPAVIGTLLDVTQRVRGEAALRESEALHRALIGALEEGVVLLLRDNRRCTCNEAAARLLGLTGTEVATLRTLPWQGLREDGAPLPPEEWPLAQTLASGEPLHGAVLGLRRPSGEVAWLSFNTRPLWRTGEELPYAVVASVVDVTERRRALAELHHRAFYDPLTGLPNRALFFDRVERALSQARRSGQLVALGFVDLDHFKQINDALGHVAGDALLHKVAQRLSRCLREGDTVARLGGDEFTLLLPGLLDVESAVRVAERVLDVLRQPVTLDGQQVRPTASIGLSLFPHDGVEVGELLRQADAAMYRVKDRGRDGYALARASRPPHG